MRVGWCILWVVVGVGRCRWWLVCVNESGKGCYERYPQMCYCLESGEKELGSYFEAFRCAIRYNGSLIYQTVFCYVRSNEHKNIEMPGLQSADGEEKYIFEENKPKHLCLGMPNLWR